MKSTHMRRLLAAVKGETVPVLTAGSTILNQNDNKQLEDQYYRGGALHAPASG